MKSRQRVGAEIIVIIKEGILEERSVQRCLKTILQHLDRKGTSINQLKYSKVHGSHALIISSPE